MRATAVVAALVMTLAVGCGSGKTSAGSQAPKVPTPGVTPIAEKTKKDNTPHKPQVLQMPDGVPMAGGVQYSTSKFAVEIHFTEPNGMPYPFAADADTPTFVSMGSDDSGGVVFLAPTKIYTATGKLEKAPSDLLSGLSENSLLSISNQAAATIGGVHATRVTITPKSIPHAKWAYCGDAYCVPIMPLPNDTPYGLIKGFTFTYYFLTVSGRSMIVSIEGKSVGGYKSFYKNALALVKTIKFASK